jgi:hypothetical protein
MELFFKGFDPALNAVENFLDKERGFGGSLDNGLVGQGRAALAQMGHGQGFAGRVDRIGDDHKPGIFRGRGREIFVNGDIHQKSALLGIKHTLDVADMVLLEKNAVALFQALDLIEPDLKIEGVILAGRKKKGHGQHY